MRMRKLAVVACAAVAGLSLTSCELEQEARQDLDYAIYLEYDAPNDVYFEAMEMRASYFWEIRQGNIDLNFLMKGNAVQKADLPDTIEFKWSHYNAAGVTLIDSFSTVANRKKNKWTYNPVFRANFKGKTKAKHILIPGFTMNPGDFLSLSVKPHGGVLHAGSTARLKLTYFPFKHT